MLTGSTGDGSLLGDVNTGTATVGSQAVIGMVDILAVEEVVLEDKELEDLVEGEVVIKDHGKEKVRLLLEIAIQLIFQEH